jgi:hypothetical protein
MLPIDGKSTNQLIFLKHWNNEDSSKTREVHRGHKYRFPLDVSGLSGDIDDLNRLPRFGDAAKSSSRTRSLWSTLPKLGESWRHSEQCHSAPRAILESIQPPKTGLADTDGILQHGLKNSLKLAGRGADDAQHLGRGFLSLERFVTLAGPLVKLRLQIGGRS